MNRQIVVGVDGSQPAERALIWPRRPQPVTRLSWTIQRPPGSRDAAHFDRRAAHKAVGLLTRRHLAPN
jgi:hypothetical protein